MIEQYIIHYSFKNQEGYWRKAKETVSIKVDKEKCSHIKARDKFMEDKDSKRFVVNGIVYV
jgi:hypothetical protein